MNDDLQLLCEIGFASVRRGLRRDASSIFAALSEMRPENACGAIGSALIQVSRGDVTDAIETLGQVEETCQEAVHEAVQIRNMIAELAEARAA
ncbi:hypothetical protein AIOL_001340 [Candidatus Rhodobacter oscarellae]|uniref:Uncharacterized protein n=1 Tax=Candidatus Rhodobacter oscarellae TaxID=1675527 RepID=A0A0J9GSC2_9RHOB|nr:hypothetical protein [Candidatus Rhodobacter lobularis]KMW56388.1 hypothetical protein AIOL_001340 [Candidatus Rhodobacter lobularis]